ncbi:MAG TPA: DUF5996 family protein [Longimicrobium sp.]|nr:DUF5996 family protein [Longimicrobium sp.]
MPQSPSSAERDAAWPALPYQAWHDTLATLHMWTQVVGKVRLALAPAVNHWWHVPLYVTPRGLTTSAMPHGERTFEMSFDFVEHVLEIRTSDGDDGRVQLRPRTVADFHAEVMRSLEAMGLGVRTWPVPVEVPDPVPFARDERDAYDAEYAARCWRVLVQADRVMQRFRGEFLGKCSPVHFFWGGFDLAVSRFSGRTAPRHASVPGMADSITLEGYSHEVSSAGFWPGADFHPHPSFYAYFYPSPEGYADARVQPEGASWSAALGEWLLPYDAVRTADDPDTALLAFLRSTYAAGAELAGWDRAALERPLRG